MTAQPYDPTLKDMVETEPESWPGFLGRPTGPTEVIDADIATVSGAADKVLRVAAATPYLLHLEFVAGHDSAVLPRKLHVRHGLREDRHGLRVRSAAVLLRPEANSPQLTGRYERAFPGEQAYLVFRYQVVRVWQLPLEPLLTGGLALLPLAPISAVTEAELPGIITADGAAPGWSARAKTGPDGLGGDVHSVGATVLTRAGGATVPRSGFHERVFDLSSHPRRRPCRGACPGARPRACRGARPGASPGGRCRGAKSVAPAGRQAPWPPGRPDHDGSRPDR
jgi:hypothetical protein